RRGRTPHRARARDPRRAGAGSLARRVPGAPRQGVTTLHHHRRRTPVDHRSTGVLGLRDAGQTSWTAYRRLTVRTLPPWGLYWIRTRPRIAAAFLPRFLAFASLARSAFMPLRVRRRSTRVTPLRVTGTRTARTGNFFAARVTRTVPGPGSRRATRTTPFFGMTFGLAPMANLLDGAGGCAAFGGTAIAELRLRESASWSGCGARAIAALTDLGRPQRSGSSK